MTSMRRKTAAVLASMVLAASAGAAHAQSAAQRLTGMKLSGDQPIQIESDKLEVLEAESKAIFSGNVQVSQGRTVLKAGNLVVFYAKGGEGSAATGSADIDRLEVSGKVYVKSDNQIATADKGSFDMKSEVLVLSGKEVVLSEGDNVAVGCKLTVQMKTGQAKLDSCSSSGTGRVKLLINPKSVQNN